MEASVWCTVEWLYKVNDKYLIQQYCTEETESYVITSKKSLFIDVEKLTRARFKGFLVKNNNN